MHCGIIWLVSTVALSFSGFGAYKYNSNGHQALAFATVDNLKYSFNVYCPINEQVAQKYYSEYFESKHLDPNLYVVFVRGDNFTNRIYNQTVTAFVPTKLRLMYCGWAREWQGTCENARHVCSYPGPMFYLPVGQEATIVYVNEIPSDLQSDPIGCYFKPTPEDCKVEAKIIDKNHQETEGCTFYQTTNLSFPTRNVIVNSQHANISPHIHGLEVRPAFDGNPYGWFNINGDKGPGYFSLNDVEYFSQFQKKQLTSMRFFTDKHNMKVIRAPNKQGPGTHFYHDHAMKSTLYNVLHGMSGMYVLYDKHVERHLPKGSQQKYLVLAPPNDDDIRTEFAKSQQPNITYKDEAEALKDTFSRNMTYRFRILNSHFENFFYNLSFGIYSETVELPDGTTFLNELDPYTQQFPVTENFTRINFTVIGTDSVLFDEPVYNADIFDLSNSERIDLLIRFSQEDGVPTHFNHVFLVVYEKSLHKYVIKHDFILNKVQTNNKYAAPIDTKPLEMPYTNLSTIPKSQIVMNRMRILLSRPPGLGYWMQGHMMSEGQADAPKIGTIEDWYFICSDSEAHPIHLHLVNFQVIQKYTLKLGGENCTYYELDFYKNSKYPAFDNLTYSQLCDFLNFIKPQQNNKLIDFMGNYSLENDFVQTDMGKVSGLNVLQPIVTEEEMRIYGQNSECPENKVYKYICANTTSSIREYYRRWRDNLHADGFTVIVSRVRWTETSYDESVREYPYFSFASEDALIEFPGYLYHCHLLDHEDKEMMRPYVLTPSDKYMEKLKKANKSVPHLTRSSNYHNAKKLQAGDVWLKKAYQINQKLNCPS